MDQATAQTSSRKHSLMARVKNKLSAQTKSFYQGGMKPTNNGGVRASDADDQTSTQQPYSTQEQSAQTTITQKQQLDILEQVLDEVENKQGSSKHSQTNQQKNQGSQPQPAQDQAVIQQSSQDQAPMGVVGQAYSHLDQTQVQQPVGGSRKESPESSGGLGIEQAASIQYVEEEKSPEMSPEVEKYLNEVKEQQEKAPKEIVIADDRQNLPSQEQYVSEPVIVLPITPEIEKKGSRKPPKFSIRWLVEWSQKIIKMFAGKVIYRQAEVKS